MSHLGQRVGLIHKLRQLVGTEERVDNARQGLCVDQVDRGKHLVITNIHSLTNGASHTHKANRELIRQLLANRTYTAVREVVDIVYVSLRVDQLDQIFDDGYHILLSQDSDCGIDIQFEFFVDTVATHIAQVVTLVREEQLLDCVACSSLIGRLRVAQLAVDIYNCLLLRVTGVFLQCVVNDRIVDTRLILLVQKNGLSTALDNIFDVLLSKFSFAIDDHLITLNRNYLTGIFVNEVLYPRCQYTCSQLTAYSLLQVGLGYLHLIGQIEDLEDLLIGLEADGTQQCGYGQLLLTVDVSIHHIVDVRCELNPRTLERNDTSRVELRTVGVSALTEEYTGRTVQL